MLKNLSSVDWPGLRTAYGDASDVPELLRTLRDAGAEESEYALEQLSMAVCPQAVSLTEAASATIPFLVELAQAREVHDRPAILALLEAMARAARRSAAHTASTGSSGDSSSEDAPGHVSDELAVGTLHALLAQRDALVSLLADPSADVRARAALCLGSLAVERGVPAEAAPHAGSSVLVDQLERALTIEPDSAVRVAYVAAFEELGSAASLRGLLGDSDGSVRLAAGLALQHFRPLEPRALQLVRDAFAQRSEHEQQYGRAAHYRPLHWVEDLCAAGAEALAPLLPEVLLLLSESPTMRERLDLAPLLQLYFPQGATATPSLEQSALAATLADHPAYFGRVANACALIARAGLPMRSGALRRYARKGPMEHRALAPWPDRDAGSARARAMLNRTDAMSERLVLRIVDDSVLALLPPFVGLRSLHVANAELTAAGIRALRALPELDELVLEDLTLDPAIGQALAQLPALRTLVLIDVPELDSALPALHFPPSFESLEIQGGSLSARGLSTASSWHLRELEVYDADLTVEARAIIAKLRSEIGARVKPANAQ